MGLTERWTWKFDTHPQCGHQSNPKAAALFETVWALEKRREGQGDDEVMKGGRAQVPWGTEKSWHPLGSHMHPIMAYQGPGRLGTRSIEGFLRSGG